MCIGSKCSRIERLAASDPLSFKVVLQKIDSGDAAFVDEARTDVARRFPCTFRVSYLSLCDSIHSSDDLAAVAAPHRAHGRTKPPLVLDTEVPTIAGTEPILIVSRPVHLGTIRWAVIVYQRDLHATSLVRADSTVRGRERPVAVCSRAAK